MRERLQKVTDLLNVKTGHVMVEYSVVLVAIGILCIAVVEAIGLRTGDMFTKAEPGLK